jgi:rRNA maturation RNase YbeY
VMSKKSNILFFTADTTFVLRHKLGVRSWLSAVAKQQGRTIDALNIIFCSDTFLYDLNVRFLQHETLTDIITFDHSAYQDIVNGELFISIDRVKENAFELGVSQRDEVHRVIVHGFLHLCGFKDKKAIDKIQMSAQEDFSLSLRKFL